MALRRIEMKLFARVLLSGAALGFALAATPAIAQDFDVAYDNTILVTLAGGEELRYYFEPDGSFRGVMPDGAEVSGAWDIDGEEICFLGAEGDRDCAPYHADKAVGDSWAQPGMNGEDVTVTIVAGR
jgi:hypothetical protein